MQGAEPGMVAAADQERAAIMSSAMTVVAYYVGLKAGDIPDELAGALTTQFADFYWRSHFGLSGCDCG